MEGTEIYLIVKELTVICSVIIMLRCSVKCALRGSKDRLLEWNQEDGTKLLFSVFGTKTFPIRFKLLRKVNILVNASERFIGDPKCNLLGD